MRVTARVPLVSQKTYTAVVCAKPPDAFDRKISVWPIQAAACNANRRIYGSFGGCSTSGEQVKGLRHLEPARNQGVSKQEGFPHCHQHHQHHLHPPEVHRYLAARRWRLLLILA